MIISPAFFPPLPLPLPLPPLPHPSPHKRHLPRLRLPHRRRRQLPRRLIPKQPVLIPMMHRALNEYKRPIRRTDPLPRNGRMRRRPAPRILLPVDDGQPIVRDAVAAVLVDGVDVRRGGDVEGVAADGFREGEVDQAADEREDGARDAGAGLQEAPLGAVLVGPGAPGLRQVVLRVEGGVVGVVAAVDVGCAGRDERFADPAGEVEHCGCEEGGFVGGAAADVDEVLDGVGAVEGAVEGAVVEGAVGGDVAAVFEEAGVVDGGIPVAALPASDAVAEGVHHVAVVPGETL